MLSRVVENIKYVSKSICSVYCAFKLVSIVGYPSTVWPHGLSGQHSKGQTHLSGSTGGGNVISLPPEFPPVQLSALRRARLNKNSKEK